MLIEICKETKGKVEDCDIVMASSNRYREDKDYIQRFINEKIEKTGKETVMLNMNLRNGIRVNMMIRFLQQKS